MVTECSRCRKDVPAQSSFCRRCGQAQGPDPLTRATRRMARARRHHAARAGGALFGLEPVLWLFAALGGIAMSAVRNFNRLASAHTVGYAVGGALTLLVIGAVVARIGWLASRRSHAIGILSGMAVIFFVALVTIANLAGPSRPKPGAAVTLGEPVRTFAAQQGGRLDDSPANGPANGPANRIYRTVPTRALPTTAVTELPVRWRYSGRRIDCTIKNMSRWQVEDVKIQLTVWAERRVIRTQTFDVAAVIPVGNIATVDLPVLLDLEPQQSFDCRVIAARGFEQPTATPHLR